MTNRNFRSFVESERHRFISYVRSLLTETAEMDAEDIVHDVLVRILERGDPASPLENLAAYVYRSLRNRVIDSVRTKKPTMSLDVDKEGRRFVDLLRDAGPNALETLISQQGRHALFEALDTLSEMEREVVIQHEFEGVPFKELSRRMNVPLNTLLSHKSRAIKKLRERILES